MNKDVAQRILPFARELQFQFSIFTYGSQLVNVTLLSDSFAAAEDHFSQLS